MTIPQGGEVAVADGGAVMGKDCVEIECKESMEKPCGLDEWPGLGSLSEEEGDCAVAGCAWRHGAGVTP